MYSLRLTGVGYRVRYEANEDNWQAVFTTPIF